MNVAERLKELRRENNLTQGQVAEKLNIPYQQYQKWENDYQKPQLDSLKKLSRVFGVSISYLVCETNVRGAVELENILEKLSEKEQSLIIEYAKTFLEK